MISRRTVLIAAGVYGSIGPAFAKADDLALPPPLKDLHELALTRPEGAATTLGANLANGRAAVISLWATWCGPCSQEASHLADLRGRISTDRLEIVGINIDARRDETKIAAFLKGAKVNFTQLRGDPSSTYLAFNGQMPITLPRLYVFTPAGAPTKVFGRYNGKSTLTAIDSAINAAVQA